LLYSKEFYAVISRRLRPDGIVQQWLPYGDAVVQSAVARSLKESFPYVRVFRSVTGQGFHFLAGNQPIPNFGSDELARHMPPTAVQDLMEWGPQATPQLQFSSILATELSVDQLIAKSPRSPALSDDRPVNEYFMLRRYAHSDWQDSP
jgi:predicted membrane-bound spermidine synthase